MTRTVLSIALISVFLTAVQAAITTQLGSFSCKSVGRFPDPNYCEGYINCIADGEGNLVQKVELCEAGVFHPEERICVNPKKVPECVVRSSRALQETPQFDYLCIRGASFACASCKKIITCLDGKAYSGACDTGTSCELNDVFGAVCKTDYLVETCSCSNNSGVFLNDPYDPASFFFCTEAGERMPHQCPVDETFDEDRQRCVNADGTIDIDMPSCQKHGYFAVQNNCKIYYSCTKVHLRWVQYPFQCENEEQYNEVRQRCENPCSWISKTFTSCEKEGRFSHNTDCHLYYECIANPDVEDGFDQKTKYCPIGSHWKSDEENEGMGGCVLSSESDCEVADPQCIIPDDCPSDK